MFTILRHFFSSSNEFQQNLFLYLLFLKHSSQLVMFYQSTETQLKSVIQLMLACYSARRCRQCLMRNIFIATFTTMITRFFLCRISRLLLYITVIIYISYYIHHLMLLFTLFNVIIYITVIIYISVKCVLCYYILYYYCYYAICYYAHNA